MASEYGPGYRNAVCTGLRCLRRLFPKFILVVIGLSLVGCGGKSNLWKQSDFGMGGTYPFAAKVLDPVGDRSCSAVQLNDRTVLTAAHCISREGSFVVLTPAGATTGRETARLGGGEVEDSHDLSLLTLDEALAAAAYPVIGSRLKVGESLAFVGFGCQDWDRQTGGGAMQVGTNTITEIDPFARTFTKLSTVRGILGVAAGNGLCYGDSGGPALREGEPRELVGLSHGVVQGEDGHYSLFIDLTQPAQQDFLRAQNNSLGLGLTFRD